MDSGSVGHNLNSFGVKTKIGQKPKSMVGPTKYTYWGVRKQLVGRAGPIPCLYSSHFEGLSPLSSTAEACIRPLNSLLQHAYGELTLSNSLANSYMYPPCLTFHVRSCLSIIDHHPLA